NASQFKHSTNFVSLSNSLGVVSAKEGFNELKILLADLNHEAVRTIQPKKVNFYFEDYEAFCFYKNIIEGIDFGCENSFKNLSISCGTYKSLIDKGFEEFFRSVVVLDGDFKSSFNQTNNNVVFLPGLLRPENIVMEFLQNLPENDSFWDNSSRYTKRVFIDSINGVPDNRETMKNWFNSQIEFWGIDGSNLFTRWKEINELEANEVIERSREIIKRIMDNFYDLSTNNY
ncbi:MAG TPA: hypothetical protein PLD18_01630, partial [Flavobacterium sp.]|nr:hypothetical protein [Flavobacterium sp.]